MSELKRAGIIGVGKYLPERIMTNEDLEKMVDTSDEWITSRTGIKTRRIAAETEACSDLCYKAALKALEQSNTKAEDLDLIIVATITPDYYTPATSAVLQNKLGAKKAAAFDLSAACSGFVYGVVTGSNFITTGMYKKVLVVGAEKLSTIIDWTDRNTCVLFGDGAAAAVLGEVEEEYGMKSSFLGAKGELDDASLIVPAGGSKRPATQDTLDGRLHYLKMRGQDVFKFAVNALPTSVKAALDGANMEASDIEMVLPHQANFRIVQRAAKKLGLPVEKFYMNIERYGNTSAASVGLALVDAFEEGKIKKDDNILLVGFGGGLTYASAILKWAY